MYYLFLPLSCKFFAFFQNNFNYFSLNYFQDKPELKTLKPGGNCNLPKPVQDLICLIFDIEAMKKAMIEFEVILDIALRQMFIV